MPGSTTEKQSGRDQIFVALRYVQALWGVVLIVGLLGYSFQGTFTKGDSPTPSPVPARSTVRSIAAPPSVAASNVRPPSPLYIFVLCDGETVSGEIYNGPIYNDSVTLKATHDHDLIVAILQGRQTMFPSHAQVFQSACVKREFASAIS